MPAPNRRAIERAARAAERTARWDDQEPWLLYALERIGGRVASKCATARQAQTEYERRQRRIAVLILQDDIDVPPNRRLLFNPSMSAQLFNQHRPWMRLAVLDEFQRAFASYNPETHILFAVLSMATGQTVHKLVPLDLNQQPRQ